jgi:hypothetical protein
MAQRLKPDQQHWLTHEHRSSSVKEKYPWREWCDGSWWVIEEGRDYTVTQKTFENTVYRLKPYIGRCKLTKLSRGSAISAHLGYKIGFLFKCLDAIEKEETNDTCDFN